MLQGSTEALEVGRVGLGATTYQIRASHPNRTTYPRAAIKQAGGVAANATRARAKMAANKKVEEAYMLSEFGIKYIKQGKRGLTRRMSKDGGC